MENRQKNWHDKYYKLALLIPIAIVLFSIFYMVQFYSKNNDFIYKDISLTGGTSVTIYEKIDPSLMENYLSEKLENVEIREVYDVITSEQKAVVIGTISSGDYTKAILEEYLGHDLIDGDNSSFEFTGSVLSESFYKQLLVAISVAFFLMAIVVFIIFRTIAPSAAVIFSAFADILMTLATVNIIGFKISSAGIVAFLMLIGYSVDTDILLTSRVLKRSEGTLNERIYSAFKTGMTMTLTAVFSILAALLVVKSFSPVLTQIFTILLIGLCFDILNTWVTNVSLLKWHVERKNIGGEK